MKDIDGELKNLTWEFEFVESVCDKRVRKVLKNLKVFELRDERCV